MYPAIDASDQRQMRHSDAGTSCRSAPTLHRVYPASAKRPKTKICCGQKFLQQIATVLKIVHAKNHVDRYSKTKRFLLPCLYE